MTLEQINTDIALRRSQHRPVRKLLEMKRKAMNARLMLECSSPVHAALVREIAESRA